jgi:aminopeptidase YwaD
MVGNWVKVQILRGMKVYLRNRQWTNGLALALCFAAFAPLQSQQTWVVKPEWVRAHEDFLASDALSGRGSATRDEQIAAEYVASEFLSYGLKPAPGMSGLIQSAEVVAPELDGKAMLAAGDVMLTEGADLRLLIPTGVSSSGPLFRLAAADVRQATIPKGAIVLLTELPPQGSALRFAYSLRRSGAGVVLFVEDDALRASLAKNPNPHPPLRLNQEPGDATTLPATLAAVSDVAMQRLLAEKAGTTAVFTVHALPTKLRKTFNAVGYLTGSDPTAGTILLSAHLDHLGVVSNATNGDAIFNGANDDAAGTTGVLELAHALAAGPKLKRGILFVCYGSEEVGGLGSQFFGKHPPIQLTQIVANLEFEMIGAQDPKMPKDTLLLTGWERSNLGPILRDHGAKLGPDPYPEQHFFERSDNYSLALEGVVAHTAAGWGTPPTYHQPNDDLAHIDIDFMTTAIQALIEPIRWLAESDFKPAWNPGGQPKR